MTVIVRAFSQIPDLQDSQFAQPRVERPLETLIAAGTAIAPRDHEAVGENAVQVHAALDDVLVVAR